MRKGSENVKPVSSVNLLAAQKSVFLLHEVSKEIKIMNQDLYLLAPGRGTAESPLLNDSPMLLASIFPI